MRFHNGFEVLAAVALKITAMWNGQGLTATKPSMKIGRAIRTQPSEHRTHLHNI
jgi:hypothetical protein